ncbi:MAG: hypothetical protein QXZ44_03340 [Ferroplasma sp.]
MNIEDVIEIFKISMVNGDIDNAYSIVSKNIAKYKKKNNLMGMEFLNLILDSISNKISTDELYKNLSDTKFKVLPDVTNYDEYIMNLIDAITYSLNRYNVNYPSFDGKRCNDL